jgi:hypothetical protein
MEAWGNERCVSLVGWSAYPHASRSRLKPLRQIASDRRRLLLRRQPVGPATSRRTLQRILQLIIGLAGVAAQAAPHIIAVPFDAMHKHSKRATGPAAIIAVVLASPWCVTLLL